MVDLNYNSLFGSSNNPELHSLVVKLMGKFLKEKPIAVMNAQPGWSAVLFAPIPGTHDEIVVDIVPIDEIAMFSSIVFDEKDKIEQSARVLISKYKNSWLPLLPKNYNGILKPFFDDLEKNISSWNRIPPPSLIFGFITKDDERSEDEIKNQGVKMYKDWIAALDATSTLVDSISSKFNTTAASSNESSIFGSIFGSPDKDKLN